MAKKLDQILVIDLEATCWENLPPRGQVNDIIEVGLCTVDLHSLERVERRSIMVKPARSQVSAFCTQLTSITQEMVDDAEPLSSAIDILQNEYRSRERLFASWGDYDRRQFERNCHEGNLSYPFGPTHLNVKTLFACAFGLPREVGIDTAFRDAGLTMEGRHHRGVDDAWNIAQLLCLMLKKLRAESPVR